MERHKLYLHLLGLAALEAICAGVLIVGFYCEGLPSSALGLRPINWQSLAWGAALACFFIFAFPPVVMRTFARAGLGGFDAGLSKLAALPTWYLVLAVVVGGAAEEVLYRGYAVERLAALTGSLWLGGLVVLLFYGLAHVPMWGWGPALTTLASGGILTLFYVWRHDLPANIIAHVVTDFVGIVLGPLYARARGLP